MLGQMQNNSAESANLSSGKKDEKSAMIDRWTYVFARLTFAHLARCAAAIFLLAAALMVRFFFDVAPLISAPLRNLHSSLFKASSFWLIEVARLSCSGVRSFILMIVSKIEG